MTTFIYQTSNTHESDLNKKELTSIWGKQNTNTCDLNL